MHWGEYKWTSTVCVCGGGCCEERWKNVRKMDLLLVNEKTKAPGSTWICMCPTANCTCRWAVGAQPDCCCRNPQIKVRVMEVWAASWLKHQKKWLQMRHMGLNVLTHLEKPLQPERERATLERLPSLLLGCIVEFHPLGAREQREEHVLTAGSSCSSKPRDGCWLWTGASLKAPARGGWEKA